MESINTASNVTDEIINLMDEISNRHYSMKFYPDKIGAVTKYCENAPDAHVVVMDQIEHAWSIFTPLSNRRAGILAALREIVQFHRQSEAYLSVDLEEYYTKKEIISAAQASGAAGQPLVDLLGIPSTRYNGFALFIDSKGEILTPDQGYAVLYDANNSDWAVIVRSLDDTETLLAAYNKLFIMAVPV